MYLHIGDSSIQSRGLELLLSTLELLLSTLELLLLSLELLLSSLELLLVSLELLLLSIMELLLSCKEPQQSGLGLVLSSMLNRLELIFGYCLGPGLLRALFVHSKALSFSVYGFYPVDSSIYSGLLSKL